MATPLSHVTVRSTVRSQSAHRLTMIYLHSRIIFVGSAITRRSFPVEHHPILHTGISSHGANRRAAATTRRYSVGGTQESLEFLTHCTLGYNTACLDFYVTRNRIKRVPRPLAEQGTFHYLPELVYETTDSRENLGTLSRDLWEMKKYRGRRSKMYQLQMVFVVGMLDRHQKMKL